jgi:hypothetical protein
MARPRPVPPKFPGGRVVGLAEFLEQLRNRGFRDADAGIGDLDAQTIDAVAFGFAGQAHGDGAAFAVNLDGIAEIVATIWPIAVGIADH